MKNRKWKTKKWVYVIHTQEDRTYLVQLVLDQNLLLDLCEPRPEVASACSRKQSARHRMIGAQLPSARTFATVKGGVVY